MRTLGIILILVGLLFLLIVPPIGLVLMVVGLFMIISGFGSSNAKKTAKAIAQQMQAAPAPVTGNADAEKWAALAKYDDDISAAVAQLQPHGAAAVDKLRSIYLALNDKTKLPSIVADIQAEFAKPGRK